MIHANPIWRALTTRQTHLGVHRGGASKFVAEVSVLGGIADASAFGDLAQLVAPGERVGLFLDEPVARDGLAVATVVPLLQMTYERDDAAESPAIAPLGEADVPEMMALTELAKPGPFNQKTRDMGDYFGIREGGTLIAMAGERLRVPGATEVSAICTHPDHLGRGHAAALTSHVIARILARGERALLHVRADNARAIALYERLGFVRGHESFYVILDRR